MPTLIPENNGSDLNVAWPGRGDRHFTDHVYSGLPPQWELSLDPSTRLFSRADKPDWSYPLVYGYANVGRVVEVGEGVTSLSVGDVVFSYTAHQSVVVAAAESSCRSKALIPNGVC